MSRHNGAGQLVHKGNRSKVAPSPRSLPTSPTGGFSIYKPIPEKLKTPHQPGNFNVPMFDASNTNQRFVPPAVTKKLPQKNWTKVRPAPSGSEVAVSQTQRTIETTVALMAPSQPRPTRNRPREASGPGLLPSGFLTLRDTIATRLASASIRPPVASEIVENERESSGSRRSASVVTPILLSTHGSHSAASESSSVSTRILLKSTASPRAVSESTDGESMETSPRRPGLLRRRESIPRASTVTPILESGQSLPPQPVNQPTPPSTANNFARRHHRSASLDYSGQEFSLEELGAPKSRQLTEKTGSQGSLNNEAPLTAGSRTTSSNSLSGRKSPIKPVGTFGGSSRFKDLAVDNRGYPVVVEAIGSKTKAKKNIKHTTIKPKEEVATEEREQIIQLLNMTDSTTEEQPPPASADLFRSPPPEEFIISSMQSSLINDGVSPSVSRTFLIHGPIHVDRITEALQIVTQHHVLIRSEFSPTIIPADPNDKYSVDEEVVKCKIRKNIDVEINFTDLSGCSAEDIEAHLKAVKAPPFQVFSHEPLIRVSLVQRRAGNPEYFLVLVFARVISDFWSACLFANHLCVVYARLENKIPAEAITIVEPKLSYQHLAAQERETFVRNPEIPFRLLQYWEARCVDDARGERQLARIARLPTQPSDTTPEFDFKPLKIPQKWVRSFKEKVVLPSDCGIEEYELGQLLSLTIFHMLLMSVTKTTDYIFGYNVSIRESYPTSTFGLFGPLNNNAILRLDSSNCTSFVELLMSVNAEVLQARKHAHFPFAKAGARLGLDRLPIQVEYLAQWDVEQLSNPDEFFFPEMLIGEGCESLARFGAECYMSAVSQHAEQAYYQMKLYLWESASVDSEHITGGFSYRSDLYSDITILAIVQRFLFICEEVCLDPSVSLSKLTTLVNAKVPKITRRSSNVSPAEVNMAREMARDDNNNTGFNINNGSNMEDSRSVLHESSRENLVATAVVEDA